MTWHVLDVGSIWMKEFAAALSRRATAVCWQPVMSFSGALQDWRREVHHRDPALTIQQFPLQRGYARHPVSRLTPFAPGLVRRMTANSTNPADLVLICTTPFYAPVAERWPGPVVYYQTDLTIEYDGIDGSLVRELDRRLCSAAHSVCPNSKRIAEYFVRDAGCPPAKLTVIPNATRAANLLERPSRAAAPPPSDVVNLPRPIAGVIGNLSGNMDWEFLLELIRQTPGFSWLFVGPTDMEIDEPAQSAARAALMSMGGRVRFLGPRNYSALQQYARCFDVAVLPYRRREPTYSGSSTRFYEHLAAGRPMIATRGFAELLDKEPIVSLVDRADQAAARLSHLARENFRDALETARFHASQEGTWEARAEALMRALHNRIGGTLAQAS